VILKDKERKRISPQHRYFLAQPTHGPGWGREWSKRGEQPSFFSWKIVNQMIEEQKCQIAFILNSKQRNVLSILAFFIKSIFDKKLIDVPHLIKVELEKQGLSALGKFWLTQWSNI
jgi:hypothetical protein